MICCTTEATSRPCPESKAAGFRLTPIVLTSVACRRLSPRRILCQFLRNISRKFEHLLAGHLQDQAAVLVYELVNYSLIRIIPLHFDFILRDDGGRRRGLCTPKFPR